MLYSTNYLEIQRHKRALPNLVEVFVPQSEINVTPHHDDAVHPGDYIAKVARPGPARPGRESIRQASTGASYETNVIVKMNTISKPS
jgi:hypothetical protein